jgi:hypothetical protein
MDIICAFNTLFKARIESAGFSFWFPIKIISRQNGTQNNLDLMCLREFYHRKNIVLDHFRVEGPYFQLCHFHQQELRLPLALSQ